MTTGTTPEAPEATTIDPADVLDVRAVAEMAHITERTVRAHMYRQTMPPPTGRVMGSPWWARDVIERWIAERPGQGRPRKRAA
jgi:hypothetical protein